MAVYDDVERRLCEKCGQQRDVRTMSMIGGTGRWICKPCKGAEMTTDTTTGADLIKKAQAALDGYDQQDIAERVVSEIAALRAEVERLRGLLHQAVTTRATDDLEWQLDTRAALDGKP
jgi:hypothetical protein